MRQFSDIKLLILLLSLNILLLLPLELAPPVPGRPVVPTTLQLRCSEGEIINRAIAIDNPSSTPWVLGPVRVSCGCLQAKIKDVSLASKSQAMVELTFDSDGWAGSSRKRLFIQYIFPQTIQDAVILECQVEPSVILEHNQIDLTPTSTVVVSYQASEYIFRYWKCDSAAVKVQERNSTFEISVAPQVGTAHDQLAEIELFFEGPKKVRRKIKCRIHP